MEVIFEVGVFIWEKICKKGISFRTNT